MTIALFCPICKEQQVLTMAGCTKCVKKELDSRIAKWNSQDCETRLNDLRQRVEFLEQGLGVKVN